MPAPFGWDPVAFWATTLTLGTYAIISAFAIPWSIRRWNRGDRTERERLAGVLRGLAAEMGGEFVGPRMVMGMTDEDGEYGPVLDYGTAMVTSAGLAIEAGVQVLGGPAGKSLKLRVPLPEGRSWQPGADARMVRRHLVRDAVHVKLEPEALTIWVLTSSPGAHPRADGVKDALSLVPQVHRAADAAARLMGPR